MWHNKLGEEINKSEMFVLLLSADFLASDYILDVEVPLIMGARETKSALVAPIVLYDCAWQLFCSSYIEAAPKDNSGNLRPCGEWPSIENALAKSAKTISTAVEDHFGIRPRSILEPRS